MDTSFSSTSSLDTHTELSLSTEFICGDQNGNIRVSDVGWKLGSCCKQQRNLLCLEALTWDTCKFNSDHFRAMHKLQAQDGYILNCLLSPEFCEPQRYLAIASSDSKVKIWNVDGFTLKKTLVEHQRWVWNWVFSVDGAYLITASSDTTARLWSLSTGEDIRVYQGHQFIDGHTIDNDVLIVTETLHKRDVHEILEKFHPLGMFDSHFLDFFLIFSQNMHDLYKPIHVDTPLAAYFSEYITSEHLDEMHIEIMINTLYTSKKNFGTELGGATAEIMSDILAFEANKRAFNITINRKYRYCEQVHRFRVLEWCY
uniref:Uncharacterized protein n=1 Tax=Lactuca sativa TaxID=4236 RepID=A0A9R1XJ52_LACSA|nr:hypothetical protein LSAT_V11C400179880 [Lactuca sativa]